MPEMKTLNGYEIVDAKARQAVANIKHPTKLSELENDKGYLTEHQSLDGYATEEYVDDKVAANNTQDTFYLDLTAANETTAFITCDEEMTKFIETVTSNGDACLYLKDYYDGLFHPATVSVSVASTGMYHVSKTLSAFSAKNAVKCDIYGFTKRGTTWKYVLSNTFEYTLATKSYVNTAISDALGVIENGSY